MYIITGYVFIKTFHYVASKQNTPDIQNTLTLSLVVGYIYYKIVNLIPIHISDAIDNICIVLSALIFGYTIAMLLRNKRILKVLDFLKIRDTLNLYYWDDLMDSNYPMKVKVTFNDISYEGVIHYLESYSNIPHIILASYIIKDENDEIIKDYTKDSTKVIVLDTSKAKCVEVIYNKDSRMCDDLENLCNCNTEK